MGRPATGDGMDGTVILRTSGTTGHPSLVELTGSQLVEQTWANNSYGDERKLFLAAAEHNNPKRHRLYYR